MIRSFVFTSLLFLTVLPWAIVAIGVRPFGRHASFVVANSWAETNLWLCKVICGLEMTIEGRENLPEKNGVIYLKHSSAYETFAQLRLVENQTWVIKRELTWVPFFGWGALCLGPIPIDRSAGQSAVEQVIERGSARIAGGQWVMIFPEGTRMPAGETRRYGLSGVLLAQAAGSLITPVAHDAGYYWRRRGLRKRPGTVRFVIGPPVDPAGRDPREVNLEIQDWIETTVAKIAADAGN